jgi:hypothetical protein
MSLPYKISPLHTTIVTDRPNAGQNDQVALSCEHALSFPILWCHQPVEFFVSFYRQIKIRTVHKFHKLKKNQLEPR